MDDLVSAMAAIAIIAVLLVTLLFNVDRLQDLPSKDGPPAVQMAQSQLIPVPLPDLEALDQGEDPDASADGTGS